MIVIMWNGKLSDLSPSFDWQKSFSQSVPAYKHTSLDKPTAVQVPMYVNKSYLHAVFQNTDQIPWVCAVQSPSSISHYVVCSTCLKSGWNYLAKSERSVSRMLPKKWKTCQCHCKRYCKMYPVTAKGNDKMHLFHKNEETFSHKCCFSQ